MNATMRFQVRREVMAQARREGMSFFERLELLSELTDERLAGAAEKFGTVPKQFLVEDVAFGDGSILKAIFAWIGSPEGQNFIKFIIGLIMAIA